MREIYYCVCGEGNLVDFGDTNDLTCPDVSGYICRGCREVTIFDGADEDGYVVEGESPLS